jgi:hypothetical protein
MYIFSQEDMYHNRNFNNYYVKNTDVQAEHKIHKIQLTNC